MWSNMRWVKRETGENDKRASGNRTPRSLAEVQIQRTSNETESHPFRRR